MIGETELVIEVEATPPCGTKPGTIKYTPVIETHHATGQHSPTKANAHNGEVRMALLALQNIFDYLTNSYISKAISVISKPILGMLVLMPMHFSWSF